MTISQWEPGTVSNENTIHTSAHVSRAYSTSTPTPSLHSSLRETSVQNITVAGLFHVIYCIDIFLDHLSNSPGGYLSRNICILRKGTELLAAAATPGVIPGVKQPALIGR